MPMHLRSIFLTGKLNSLHADLNLNDNVDNIIAVIKHTHSFFIHHHNNTKHSLYKLYMTLKRIRAFLKLLFWYHEFMYAWIYDFMNVELFWPICCTYSQRNLYRFYFPLILCVTSSHIHHTHLSMITKKINFILCVLSMNFFFLFMMKSFHFHAFLFL